MTPKYRTLLVLLAVAIGIFTGCLLYSRNLASEKKQIRIRYEELQSSIEQERYKDAYGCMSETFRATQPVEEMRILFASLATPEYRMRSDMGVRITGDNAEICPSSERGLFGARFLGAALKLVREGQGWSFTGEVVSYLD